jgi:hypothetical protein
MMGRTKGSAQRTSSLRPRCVGEVDPKTTMVCPPWWKLEKNHTVRCVVCVKKEDAAKFGILFMLERFILEL